MDRRAVGRVGRGCPVTAAEQIAADIRANVEAFYDWQIDHATFCARNAALWKTAAGIDDTMVRDVTILLRPQHVFPARQVSA